MSAENDGGIGGLDNTMEFHEITQRTPNIPTIQSQYLRDNLYRYYNVNENILMSKFTEAEWNAFYETVTTATYAAGGKTYLTEPGTYKVEPQADNLLIIPKTFVLDHTQTTETLSFTIYDKNAFAAVGGYVGAYVSKN